MSLRVVMIGLLLIAAVALGLIAFQVSNPSRPLGTAPPQASAPPPPPPATASYLIAPRTLPPGTLARPEDFTVRTIPASQLPPDVVVDSQNVRTELRGALVRRF